MTGTVIPEAQGKAAALSSYLAQGGTPFRNSGRFKKGPMKGKNVDEATAEFERMWASAPDSLKQKYANRTSGKTTDLAPSERTAIPGMSPGMSPARPVNAMAKPVGGSPAVTTNQEVATPSVSATAAPLIPGVGPVQALAGKSRVDQAAILSADAVTNLPTDERMHAQGKVNGGPTPVVKAPRGQYEGSAMAINPPASVTPPAPTIGTPARINSQTGLPMGYRPGDSTAGLDQAKVAESNERVRTAPAIQGVTPAPPKATIAPATDRYADAQSQYQAGKAPATAMDKVYSVASSIDKAAITAQSMKRAAGLQPRPAPRKPLIPGVAPTRPMSFARR